MKKTVEIGVNVLFWSMLILFDVYRKVTYSQLDFPDAVQYHYTFSTALWENVSGFYMNGILGFILSFYVFYGWLVPDFLKHKRIKRLLITLSFGLFASTIACLLFGPTFSRFFIPEEWIIWGTTFWDMFFRFFLDALVQGLVFGILGVLFKATILWVQSISEKKALQKKQLESENALLLLKAQLNPHFLFNSLNNIDVLMEESVLKASSYLKKLSDILRYVLYETKEDTTTLSKELEQIENYIELQKIRTSNTQFVDYAVEGQVADQPILPMIFLPFVENAFKFSKNKSIEYGIQIRLEVLADSVRMLCRNRFEPETVVLQKNEGLGIETIRKRLELLYPKQYQLTIDSTEGWFSVDLRVPLKNDR